MERRPYQHGFHQVELELEQIYLEIKQKLIMVCNMARAGRVLVSGHIGTMPEELDVTKSSEKRLQELTERLQARPTQPEVPVRNMPSWEGLQDVIINDTTDPSRLGSLTKSIIKREGKDG